MELNLCIKKDRERETKMKARKNSNKNNRPLSPTAKDHRSSEQRSPRASAVATAESEFSLAEPRSFPYSVKQQCWEKAEKVKGRDPDRWRRDSLGNTIFRKLVGCPGCLCHDYDHIVPYSKVLLFLLFIFFRNTDLLFCFPRIDLCCVYLSRFRVDRARWRMSSFTGMLVGYSFALDI